MSFFGLIGRFFSSLTLLIFPMFSGAVRSGGRGGLAGGRSGRSCAGLAASC